MPRVFGLFDRFRPPHALAAFRVASSFAVGFSSRGGRSRGLLPGERCQGFSPLQPRHRSFVRHGPAFADAAVTDSLRPSAGGADERGCASGARCHPAIRSGDPLVATPASQSLDPAIHGAGLTLLGSESHAPSTDSTFGLDRGPTYSPDTLTEGPAPAFRPLPARSTLAARRTITGPVRVGGLPLSLDVAPRTALRRFLGRERQDASNPFLQPTFTSRAPVGNTSFGDCPPSAVGNPPTFDLETAFRPGLSPCGLRAAPDHLAVIRPPTAARLTARLPASGPSTTSFRTTSVRRRRGRPGFFGPRCLCRFEPSGTSHRRPNRESRFRSSNCRTLRALFRSHDPGSAGARQCHRSPRDRGAFRRVRPPQGPFRAPAWCAVTAGRRRQLPHVFIEVRRTATRPLFVRYSRAPSRPRALARLLQVHVSTSTTTDHFEHPERPESVVGTIAWFGRKLRFGPGNHQSFTWTGVEKTPSLDSPHRDCSR